MKIIISHDVDHISAHEHFSDLFLFKYFIRNVLELLNRGISFSEFQKRTLNVLQDKLNNIETLLNYDKEHSVRPTFFIGVNKALNLSYNHEQAKKWIELLLDEEIPVYIHGINYDTYNGILEEKELFKKISGAYPIGIRIHYLRTNDKTLLRLAGAGYRFDSTVFSLGNPYKIENLWEFPVSMMDSYLIYGESSRRTKSLEQIKNETIQCIEKAKDLGIQYLTIITHDFYFTDSFRKFREWYIWLIDYFNVHNFEFCNFDDAILELEAQ
jgi:hypothetical protein